MSAQSARKGERKAPMDEVLASLNRLVETIEATPIQVSLSKTPGMCPELVRNYLKACKTLLQARAEFKAVASGIRVRPTLVAIDTEA